MNTIDAFCKGAWFGLAFIFVLQVIRIADALAIMATPIG